MGGVSVCVSVCVSVYLCVSVCMQVCSVCLSWCLGALALESEHNIFKTDQNLSAFIYI